MRRILCYGDSNTFGQNPQGGPRFDEIIRYPRALARLLGAGYEVIEEGFPGRTTVYETFVDPWVNGRTYLYPCVASHLPLDLVVLMLGTNDLSVGVGVNAFYAAAGIQRLIRLIRQASQEWQQPCPEILVVSPPLIAKSSNSTMVGNVFPFPAAHEESKRFRAEYAAVAESEHCAFLAAEDYTETGPDGVHMTAESHLRLARALADSIEIQLRQKTEEQNESSICKSTI